MSSQGARPLLALVRANIRYWTTIAPLTRRQITRWEERGRAIPDPTVREPAIRKLHEERFNVEVAATLATLAPPAQRPDAVEAIVALQVAYDYLDLLCEQSPTVPPDGGTRPLDALVDALRPESPNDGKHEADTPKKDSNLYVRELVGTTKTALARLPAADAVSAVALACAERCAQAQLLSHAIARGGAGGFEEWAKREADGTHLRWPEYLAGAAASVLSLHALIAAAADPRTTPRDAAAIDEVYLSVGALTMLDSLVDRHHDLATGELSYVDIYGSPEAMIEGLALLARNAASRARTLPHASHHLVTLVGIVAYYTSALGPHRAFPQSITKPIRAELQPLMTPTLVVMRTWRLAKRAFSSRALKICDVSSI